MPVATRSVIAPALTSVALLALSAGCDSPNAATPADSTAPSAHPGASATTSPPSAGPGLSVGDRVGEATLLSDSGAPVALSSLYSQRPVVVTFYRGGWCPYCTRALAEWEGRRGELAAMGVDFVAITPERPDLSHQTAEKAELGFTILSEAQFQAADAFRVRFSLDERTRTQYKGYGVDLAAVNAAGMWDLPAPGTFLIDTQGIVRYAWADWDYRQRANPDEVIGAARALAR